MGEISALAVAVVERKKSDLQPFELYSDDRRHSPDDDDDDGR